MVFGINYYSEQTFFWILLRIILSVPKDMHIYTNDDLTVCWLTVTKQTYGELRLKNVVRVRW